MAETNIRYVTDERDNIYYPITHMDAIEGFDISGLEDINDIKEGLENVQDQSSNASNQLSSLQNKLSSLETTINTMVKDTGWMNITLLNNAVPYSSTTTPQARMISFNGVTFVSLKGAVKGLKSNKIDIGKLPDEISVMLTNDISFAQNMFVSGDTAQFTRMRLNADGTLKIEKATLDTITESQWFPIDITIMV